MKLSRLAVLVAAHLACLMLMLECVSAQSSGHGAGVGQFFFAASGSVGKFVVLSEKDGAEKFKVNNTGRPNNLQRKAVNYSPLAWYMPQQWVPIVASVIGAMMISLFNQIIGLIKAYLESIISNRRRSKAEFREDAVRVVGIKVREVFSVTAAAFVLGAAFSWTYAGPSEDFLWLLGINTAICLFAGISHEAVHRIVGRVLGIKSEYTFWFSGSFMTIFTAILGNAFGLQGFLVEKVKEGTAKWKVGAMKLAAPVFSCGIFLVFAAVNFLYPNVVFQMIYSISGMQAMAEILPFSPMDGHDVRKWNFLVWLAAFLSITVPFTLLSFVM